MDLLTPNTKQEQDAAFDPEHVKSATALETAEQDQREAFDRDFEDPERMAKDGIPGDLSGRARRGEATPSFRNRFTGSGKGKNGNKNEPFDKVAFLKRKGPLAGILVTLVAGGFGIAGLLSPSLIIIHLKEMLVQSLDSASPTLGTRTQAIFAKKVANVKSAFAESGNGVCNIRCKFGTISETMLRNLRAKGFTVETDPEKFAGRYVIKELTFPGESEPIKDAQAFKEALKDVKRSSAFESVFRSKTAFFLNSRFGNALKTRLGLDKLSKFTGETKDKVLESFREFIGLPPQLPDDPAARTAAIEKAKQGKLGPVFKAIDGAKTAQKKAADPISYACLVYNADRKITHAVKVAKIAAFAAVAMLFLTLADQIIAGDNPNPAALELAGNQLTQTDTSPTNADGTPNEYYGKSALDSSALGIDLYTDNPGTLSSQDEAYSVGPSGDFLKGMVGVAAFLLVGGVAAIVVARNTCKLAGLASLVTACAEEIATAIALAAETAGVGSVGSAVVCIAKLGLIVAAISAAVGIAISAASTWATASEALSYDETSHAPPVGHMIHDGSASGVFAVKSEVYGLHAGSAEAVGQYAIDTAAMKRQEDAVARYEAQSTPFDVYNQYSFLGSMARSIDITSFANPTVSSLASSITSIIPKAFASLTAGVSATDITTDADKKAAIYANCTDPALTNINVGCDAYGNPSYVMNTAQINTSSDTALDYLLNNNQIDEEKGEPIAGSDYEKYMTYCANRLDPLGETSADIESNDFEWQVGLKCTEDSEALNDFGVYTMDKAIVDTLDGDDGTTSTSSEALPEATPSDTTTTDTTPAATTDTTVDTTTTDTTTNTTTDSAPSAFIAKPLAAMLIPIGSENQTSLTTLSKRRELQWTA